MMVQTGRLMDSWRRDESHSTFLLLPSTVVIWFSSVSPLFTLSYPSPITYLFWNVENVRRRISSHESEREEILTKVKKNQTILDVNLKRDRNWNWACYERKTRANDCFWVHVVRGESNRRKRLTGDWRN